MNNTAVPWLNLELEPLAKYLGSGKDYLAGFIETTDGSLSSCDFQMLSICEDSLYNMHDSAIS